METQLPIPAPTRLRRHPPRIDCGAALDRLPSAVLVLVGDRIVYGNTSASALLGEETLCAGTLEAALDRASRKGLFSPAAAEALIGAAGAEGPGATVVPMRDGRVLACRRTRLDEGQIVLDLADVTAPVRAAEARHRDPLTGLAVLPEFLLALERALAEPAGQSLAVVSIGLDRIRAVTDTLGHEVGDGVLKLAAERIARALGPLDVLARPGGEAFVLLHRGEGPEAAEHLAHRLADLLGRAYLVKGQLVNISASLGVAVAQGDGIDAKTLCRNADLALGAARSAGGNTTRIFAGAMIEALQARRSLEMDLRQAVVLGEFWLAFQPQFAVKHRRLVGFEALLRWTHPEKGPIAPARFIPLAEELGLIVPIGEWVLRTACRAAAAWPAAIGVAVNLSPLQIRTPRLLETVVSALAEAGLPPARLDLEITEGTLLEESAAVLDFLGRLRTLGVRVSMDDFGTGYSSLGYLLKFPFEKIKIDQFFVRNMVVDPDSAAIVRAVSALGASLGITTLAEGVETEEQFALIGQQGVGQVQGYLTGRPLTLEAASALAASAYPERERTP